MKPNYIQDESGQHFAFDCKVAYRLDSRGLKEWLILNGNNMGRWTYWFGPNCLADSADCLNYLQAQLEENKSLIVQDYTVQPQ